MIKHKYTLSYTKKNESGYFREMFYRKKDAEAFLKSIKKTVYWHQLLPIYTKSRMPRPVIKFTPPETYEKMTGRLNTYFETGMECLGLVFENSAITGSPNPNFDSSKPESEANFKNYASYDALHFITTGMIIEFEDGTKVGMMKDRTFSRQDGFRLSFYPQGYSKEEWMELFEKRTKVVLYVKKENNENR